MVKYVKISGEKLERVVADSMLDQDGFANAVGMKRSGIFRLTRPGTHNMRPGNFRSIAQFLRISTDELKERIGADAKTLTRDHRVLRLPADVYDGVLALAEGKGVSIADYLAGHVENAKVNVRRRIRSEGSGGEGGSHAASRE